MTIGMSFTTFERILIAHLKATLVLAPTDFPAETLAYSTPVEEMRMTIVHGNPISDKLTREFKIDEIPGAAQLVIDRVHRVRWSGYCVSDLAEDLFWRLVATGILIPN